VAARDPLPRSPHGERRAPPWPATPEALVPGDEDAVATRVRLPLAGDRMDLKRRFCPRPLAKLQSTTASLSSIDLTPRIRSHPRRQAGPFRCRPTVHWGWLDFVRVKLASEGSPGMDGADHVSSTQMPIRRRGSLDLENGRLAKGHATPIDGQDSQCVDWLRFPQECFF
jgi:hypothetical protein